MSGPTIGTIRGTIQLDYDGKGIVKAQDDVDKLTDKGENSAEKLDKLGNSLALFGGLVAGGFAVATASAVSFEKRLSAIEAVSGATGDQMKALSDKALQLGKDTSFSAGEAAMAMEELVKAGLSVEEVLGGAADATVALAAAGEIDLPKAAMIASNAMNQFNLTAGDMNLVVDQIAGAANASAIDVHEFGMSLSQVGAVAHLAGQSFEDTATAIALMGNAGIKGSDAGTSLKTMLSNLIPVTDRQISMFEKLGLSTDTVKNAFLNADGSFKSLKEISGTLHESLDGLSESQRQQALETIFGSDAIRAAAVLANQGAEGFQNMNDAMSKSTAAEVAAKRLDNAAGALEELKGSAETAAIQIGTVFIPILQSLVNKLTTAVNWFSSLGDGTRNAILGMVGALGGLALVAAGIIKLVQFFTMLKSAIAVIKTLTMVTRLITAAQAAWTAITWALNAAFIASPIGWIILGIIALVAVIVLLWMKCETFRKIVLAVWHAILVAVKAVVAWFMNDALPVLTSVWEGIVVGAKWLWGWIVKIFDAIVQSAKFYIGIFMAVWNFLWPGIKAVWDLIIAVIQTAWAVISAIFTVMATVIKAVIDFIWPYVSKYIGMLVDFWVAAFQVIWAVVSTVFKQTQAIIKAVLDVIWPYVSKIIGLIVTYITASFNTIKAIVTTVWPYIRDFIMAVWNAIVSIVQSGVNRIVAIVEGIRAFIDKVRGFFNQLKEAASGGVGSLISFIGTIPGKIISALGNVGKMLYNSGRRIIQGLIDGVSSMIGALKSKISSALESVRNLLPFSPAKEGPFSGRGWTTYSGRALIEGLARGIEMSSTMPVDAMARALSGTAGTIGPTASASTSGASTSSSTTTNTRTVSIGNVNLTGVWDFTDPGAARDMVAKIHDELDKYEKEYV